MLEASRICFISHHRISSSIIMGVVDDTFGAFYIGQQLATLLLGGTIVQTWIFVETCCSDMLYIRITVTILLILGIILSCLMAVGLYPYFVSSIVDPSKLAEIPRVLEILPFIAALNVFIVQWFYAWRLYLCSNNIAIMIIILVLGAVKMAALQFKNPGIIISGGEAQKNLATVAYVADLACDTMITGSMVVYLHCKRSGLRSSADGVLCTLMHYTLASGLITLIGSFVCLVTYLVLPAIQVSTAIIFTLPHLYTNSLLALLNARKSLRQCSQGRHPDAPGLMVSVPSLTPLSHPETSSSSACEAPATTDKAFRRDIETGHPGEVIAL
ncbi:hypothetical protein EXIGLDRAFT_315232 [Exidia glandulosa HHB12029]|uniref:DUF6534 domain-containing protein n=1 Tax=Exidia glandulosa HHB12029 TaxID=1314781 RepID=A0A165CXX1_EXIGL|nr:hypothetical protein EXIGLDRAFT_315232 [Exidia glandulosa HHB12029]